MTDATNLITAEGLQSLNAELAELEGEGRREIAERIKTAREWGDLKENSEYHDAKNEQAHLETKIARVREKIAAAVVVEDSAPLRAGWSASVRPCAYAPRTAPSTLGGSSAPTTQRPPRAGCRLTPRSRSPCSGAAGMTASLWRCRGASASSPCSASTEAPVHEPEYHRRPSTECLLLLARVQPLVGQLQDRGRVAALGGNAHLAMRRADREARPVLG